MLRNMTLARKMAFGFGTLVVISAILGYVGWSSLKKVSLNVELMQDGQACLEQLNQSEIQRREFAVNGYALAEGQEEDASQKWHKTYAQMNEAFVAFESRPDLHENERSVIGQCLSLMAPYEAAFNKSEQATSLKDEAFKEWGRIGWDVTNQVSGIITEEIGPARASAESSEDVEKMIRWSQISSSLDEDVYQEFLKLRIYAVYLVATNADAQWQGYSKQLDVMFEKINTWQQFVQDNTKLKTVASTIQGLLDTYRDAGQKYYDGILMQRECDQEMASVASQIVSHFGDLNQDMKEEVVTLNARANWLVGVITASGIVLGIVLAYVITLSIVRPVNRIIAGLTRGAEQVSAASSEVSSASQSLAEGTTEQAASLEETSSSLEEMASMTTHNSDNAQEAKVLADEAQLAANEGSEAMERMSVAINDIQNSSDETAKIIKVIDEIAFQTNLLALNAAVEAARAGEAGKGFAVVAEEVRNLAMRSAEAAKNTSNMISDSVKNAKHGVDIAGDVGNVLERIVQSIGKTNGLVAEIAAASQEQSQGIGQINNAISQMDQVTQQNAAVAEESAAAAGQLSSQAEGMNQAVEQLVALVGGDKQPSGSLSKKVVSKRGGEKLSRSDEMYHQIAKSPKKVTLSPKEESDAFLPLDEESVAGFDHFNG